MQLPLTLLALAIALLALESIVLHRDVSRLTRRIHIGGTRGKSSVTRYIAAGLRAGGDRAWGKITGTRPTLIREDGSHRIIKRRGGARVQEQFGIIRRAVRHDVGALALECMSITPELQSLESRMFRPHVYVLTSIRDDHREHLGVGDDQITAMCSGIPREALVVTDDLTHRDVILGTATSRGSRVLFVDKCDDQLAASCPDGVFPMNLTLALRACEAVGIASHTARAAILNEAAGEREATAVDIGLGATRFVNGFAVNDVESAEQFLEHWRARASAVSKLVIILNTRTDRPLRSVLFAQWIAGLKQLSGVVLVGDHTACAARALARAGMEARLVTVWKRRQLDNIPEALRALDTQDALVVGLGNIGGAGFRIAESLGASV